MTKTSASVNPQPGSLAPLTNCVLFDELLDRVTSRHRNLPSMGAFTGFSGDGKTSSAALGAHRHEAYYIEVGSSWTLAKFCQSLSTELGIPARGTIATMIENIISHLSETQRPLIIDEFDHVVNRKYVENIREIHDKSQAAIVLIGEEQLPYKLQQWERFHNRVLNWVQSQPCDLKDASVLAQVYAAGLTIEADLLGVIVEKTGGNTRRIAVNLDRIREEATLEGWKKIDRSLWGTRPIFTGAMPARRAR
jgi:DNA transposition AAA+ family ATPase